MKAANSAPPLERSLRAVFFAAVILGVSTEIVGTVETIPSADTVLTSLNTEKPSLLLKSILTTSPAARAVPAVMVRDAATSVKAARASSRFAMCNSKIPPIATSSQEYKISAGSVTSQAILFYFKVREGPKPFP